MLREEFRLRHFKLGHPAYREFTDSKVSSLQKIRVSSLVCSLFVMSRLRKVKLYKCIVVWYYKKNLMELGTPVFIYVLNILVLGT